ncbi:MAG: F-type H+-transporting ATPase subunit b, partial [Acidobacteriota bacterium]
MRFESLHSPTRLRVAHGAVVVWLSCVAPAVSYAAVPQREPAAAAAGESDAPNEQTGLQTVAKLANFAVLAGVLVYFLRAPIARHLSSRASAIREDLVTAAAMRAAATEQLAQIDRKLKTLPAELEALKAQGAQDVAAEQARIEQAAAAERERLLEQTRREIDMRLRVARRELTAHAAQLAVN